MKSDDDEFETVTIEWPPNLIVTSADKDSPYTKGDKIIFSSIDDLNKKANKNLEGKCE